MLQRLYGRKESHWEEHREGMWRGRGEEGGLGVKQWVLGQKREIGETERDEKSPAKQVAAPGVG